MDLNSLIQLKRKRFEQLERDIADPALFSNRQRASEIMREHANIKQLLAKWDELEVARKQLDDNRELAMSRDVEIAAMADDEIPELEKRVADLERDVQIALLPPDENEDRCHRRNPCRNGGKRSGHFRRRPLPHVSSLCRICGPENRGLGIESVRAWRIQGSDLSSFGRIGFSKTTLRKRRSSCATRPCDGGARPHSYIDGHSRSVAGGRRCRSRVKAGRPAN